MAKLERIIRTGASTPARIDSVLSAIILAELLNPSDDIWLVSPWISDIAVLDNRQGDFDALFAEEPPGLLTLAQALAGIVANADRQQSRSRLHIVSRPDTPNRHFLGQIDRLIPADLLTVTMASDVHEKTFCGRDWILTGSMNFTMRGISVNDEAMTYQVAGSEPARTRLDLAQRWR